MVIVLFIFKFKYRTFHREFIDDTLFAILYNIHTYLFIFTQKRVQFKGLNYRKRRLPALHTRRYINNNVKKKKKNRLQIK